MVTVLVEVMVVTVLVGLVGRQLGNLFGGGCGDQTVVLAQATDGDAGLRPGTAHAFRGGPVVVVVLARRQAAALHQEQRAAVRVQQRADVLQDFVTQ